MQWTRAVRATGLGYTEADKVLVPSFSLFKIPFLPLNAQASSPKNCGLSLNPQLEQAKLGLAWLREGLRRGWIGGRAGGRSLVQDTQEKRWS